MPQTIRDDYFDAGVFRGAREGELFARHTCAECGYRSPTWALFRAHREGRSELPCRPQPGRGLGAVEALLVPK